MKQIRLQSCDSDDYTITYNQPCAIINDTTFYSDYKLVLSKKQLKELYLRLESEFKNEQ